eukprot:Sspe_Gene.43064::Locus_20941_Transcript_1_1_Confidence_1.000_Length_464::g.43064::m.43064
MKEPLAPSRPASATREWQRYLVAFPAVPPSLEHGITLSLHTFFLTLSTTDILASKGSCPTPYPLLSLPSFRPVIECGFAGALEIIVHAAPHPHPPPHSLHKY